MIWLYLIWFAFVASFVMTAVGAIAGCVMLAMKVYDFCRARYIAWRNERLLQRARADIRIRRAMHDAQSFGLLPDDLQ